jgi:cytolysin-activating lysine-acyltransferase
MSVSTADEMTMSKPAAPDANGSAKPLPAAKATHPRDSRQARMAQSFSQVVAVLMRDPNFRNMRLAELEWLVLPAVMSGQFKLAHARVQPGTGKADRSGVLVPMAVALWARVSPSVDKTLSENLDKPVQIKATEWASGDIPWLIAVAGNPNSVPAFLKQLAEHDFKGQQVKMRTRTKDNGVAVKTLDCIG